jgi:hypothetical protein
VASSANGLRSVAVQRAHDEHPPAAILTGLAALRDVHAGVATERRPHRDLREGALA